MCAKEKRVIEKCNTRHKDCREEFLVVEKKKKKEVFQWLTEDPTNANNDKVEVPSNKQQEKRPATNNSVSRNSYMHVMDKQSFTYQIELLLAGERKGLSCCKSIVFPLIQHY